MERMGDKARAKAEMKAAGVPLVPGTEGGGLAGRGARRRGRARLPGPARRRSPAAAARACGSCTGPRSSRPPTRPRARRPRRPSPTASLYLEKALVPARHVEIQVLCDKDGGVLTLGERECSIQRRHQKLVEESPSPALDPDTREEMEAAAERACRTIGYENAGTFEFLLGPDGTFHFIELNARLQVEHPVSEIVTGIDIVRQQLRIAAGRAAAGHGPRAAARATRSRSASMPRIRPTASRPPRARSSASGPRSGRVSGSTRISRRARRSPPTTTR